MEPVTHLLTGACLARAGFNRKAAYATLAMTLAAEAPDLDMFWSVKGPIAAFQHHRGITHTLLGLPFDGLLILAGIWLFHRWQFRRSRTIAKTGVAIETHRFRGKTVPPIRWGLLYLFILVALLSHLILDWTNNYGIRPFFPFNPHWYAGSFVFIFEPLLWLFLLTGLIAPALFGLINSEVGARRPAFRGRGWAIAALIACTALWTLRFYEHAQALALATNATYTLPADPATPADTTIPPIPPIPPILRTFASPQPLNPFRWATIAETPLTFQLGAADTLTGTLATHAEADTVYKPPTTIPTLVAKRSWLGEVYLDWSQWPLVTDTGTDRDGNTTVTFRDLRFLSGSSIFPGRQDPPLSGSVLINADHRVARMAMDHRIQH